MRERFRFAKAGERGVERKRKERETDTVMWGCGKHIFLFLFFQYCLKGRRLTCKFFFFCRHC